MLVIHRQTDGRTDRLMDVKKYAPDLSMQGHKNRWKERKCPFPPLLLFPYMFSKGFFPSVVKTLGLSGMALRTPNRKCSEIPHVKGVIQRCLKMIVTE